MINISLCILAKNEGSCIKAAIDSAKHFVNEVLVVDDHSTDDTEAMATLGGATVIKLPFTVAERGFAEAANWMVEKAKHEWILIIDADELLGESHLLQVLTRYPDKEVWALPRRKWFEYPHTRMELERYPDWQVRFFKKGSGTFVGQMHVTYKCPRIYYAYRGPHIEHLQTEHRDQKKVEHRAQLYPALAAQQGVEVHGGDVVIVVRE